MINDIPKGLFIPCDPLVWIFLGAPISAPKGMGRGAYKHLKNGRLRQTSDPQLRSGYYHAAINDKH